MVGVICVYRQQVMTAGGEPGELWVCGYSIVLIKAVVNFQEFIIVWAIVYRPRLGLCRVKLLEGFDGLFFELVEFEALFAFEEVVAEVAEEDDGDEECGQALEHDGGGCANGV